MFTTVPLVSVVGPDAKNLQYKKYGKELCDMLDGMFSFVLLDESVTPTRIIAARDPIGITTLYQGRISSKPGVVMFASELKALPTECDEIISFPPGHVYDSQTDTTERYFKSTWWDTDHEDKIPTSPVNLENLRKTLEAAVKKRLMSEVPYGVLLSGGLDSSLIAAIAARETEKVAQAQAEVRRKKLAKASSGPGSPNLDGVSEYGAVGFLSSVIRSLIETILMVFRDDRDLATTPLVRNRARELTRSARGQESRTLPPDRPPRIRVHGPGGFGCGP
jgi:asparagine synthetase B (glutamine-hydrolysing)